MRAMILEAARQPLRLANWPQPAPGPGEVLLRIEACAVCRTDLHVVDGELSGSGAAARARSRDRRADRSAAARRRRFEAGARVGVPWLGWTCGVCAYCRRRRRKSLRAGALHRLHAMAVTPSSRSPTSAICFPLPDSTTPHAAPLLCAGLIGYRALRRPARRGRLGLYGFGAAAHIVAQVARQEGRGLSRSCGRATSRRRRFARELGACGPARSDEPPPEPLDAAIIFAPVGALVPVALSGGAARRQSSSAPAST